MLISLHDVPCYERHLLFCSNLSHKPNHRRRTRSDLPEINRSLAVCNEAVAPGGLSVLPTATVRQPLVGVA